MDTQHDDQQDDTGGTVSEGGSGALNADTALGGADSVPDTPDTNDTGEADGKDANVPGRERRADGDLGVGDGDGRLG